MRAEETSLIWAVFDSLRDSQVTFINMNFRKSLGGEPQNRPGLSHQSQG
jgi:hypothetical protein